MPPAALKSVNKRDPVTMPCEWQDCDDVYEDIMDFMAHVTDHLNELAPNDFEDGMAESEYGCEWKECGQDNLPDFPTLVRHVFFHSFHVKLKSIGTTIIFRNKLQGCLLDSTSRNMIPDLLEQFHCGWQDCNRMFDNPVLFYIHVRDHCEVYPPTKDVPGGVKCLWQNCKEVKKNKYKLANHLKTHSQEKEVACPTCGSLFSTPTKFFDHIKRQQESDIQNYQCSHCDKQFSTERLLRDHMRHHVNHSKCPFCDMTLPNQSSLRSHVTYRHMDDRPHQCACGLYSGKTLKDLRAHEETHTDASFLKCGMTNCTFRTRSMGALNQHYERKHSDGESSRYACHVCDKKYFRGNKLTVHLRKSHKFQWPPGHKRFKYKLCEDGFYRLQTVRYESVELTNLKMQQEAEKEKQKALREAEMQSEKTAARAGSDIENEDANQTVQTVVSTEEPNYSYNLDLLGDVALQAKCREDTNMPLELDHLETRPCEEYSDAHLPPKKRRKRMKDLDEANADLKKFGRCEIITNDGHKIIVESDVPFAGVASHIPDGAETIYAPNITAINDTETFTCATTGQMVPGTGEIVPAVDVANLPLPISMPDFYNLHGTHAYEPTCNVNDLNKSKEEIDEEFQKQVESLGITLTD